MNKFSLWCDFIENSFLDNAFLNLLSHGVNGATSNPAIFKNAILNSPIYQDKILKLKGKKAKEIYEELAICDIQKAADKLAPLFYQKNDGFISIEIDPRLYNNTTLSLGEAKRLYTNIAKENVMIKIPATPASYEVMYELMKNGICVNATLIFSLEQSQKCFEALNAGLTKFRQNNPKRPNPQAVISIFVSRFDKLLNSKAKEQNRIGILNANLIYNNIISKNESNIRALFASTGVKEDNLAKDYYIQELLFNNCINTAPLDAIQAFKTQTNFKKPLMNHEIYTALNQIISQNEREKAYNDLLNEGLNQFCIAFEEILEALN
ncbi:transaldolase [Campylobacter sp. VicNov18]|uniref:transaldolase n=1 Tax=Campylobacter bilis TaxID=2691918 RepID=UPI00130EB4CF|nr:transaldolase [Campylobacter bilis]MPV63241.1 transaldolase [Campylobacter hepaticus]MBM0636740.1 transaldolase [Campylobacter bilis]MCC8277312.1 transaldolase [Campylobacter bilis]MCC8299055.1 transaldolase [Campylobacter bilis]MCC8300221.1 transaldolase [Campylobacter bilis]